MANWEDRLSSWTGPASDSEDEKRDRTEQQVKEAIAAHPRLSKEAPKVYAKGSYANNTNVRADSDVDLAVEYTGGFQVEFQDDTITREAAGIQDYTGPYTGGGKVSFGQFKSDVHEALVAAFGADKVRRRDKCLTVSQKATTLPADVVPCWEHHSYFRDWSGVSFVQGTVLWPDAGATEIQNFPQQHYDNGVAKNKATHRRFKSAVRMMKRLENEMVEQGAHPPVPSYLIECLVYRCSNWSFNGASSWLAMASAIIGEIYHGTQGAEPADGNDRWLEVNDIKFLFHTSQKWTRSEANSFSVAAWNHLGLGG